MSRLLVASHNSFFLSSLDQAVPNNVLSEILSKLLSVKFGVCLNIALYTSPTARSHAFLVSTFSIHSHSFSKFSYQQGGVSQTFTAYLVIYTFCLYFLFLNVLFYFSQLISSSFTLGALNTF